MSPLIVLASLWVLMFAACRDDDLILFAPNAAPGVEE